LDEFGNVATNDNSQVTLSLATHPKYAVLSGTLTEAVTHGVAAFNNLSLNRLGFYTLRAMDGNTSLPAIYVPLFIE
jgi:hypothetical protein